MTRRISRFRSTTRPALSMTDIATSLRWGEVPGADEAWSGEVSESATAAAGSIRLIKYLAMSLISRTLLGCQGVESVKVESGHERGVVDGLQAYIAILVARHFGGN